MAGAPHLKAFIDAAIYFIGIEETGSNTFASGSLGEEMCSLSGFSEGGSWCAMFVSACAEKAGIAGKLIDKYEGVGSLIESVLTYDGDWIEGPYFTGTSVTPIPGDVISFVGNPASYYSGYGHGGHVGIVEYVDDEQVHTIEGNTGYNDSRRKSYALNDTKINGYSRPNWELLGDDVSSYLAAVGLGYDIGPLYSTTNDRHDMTLREVGYLDGDYELTNKQTGIAISIINYTTVLGQIYDLFAPANVQGVYVDTTHISGDERISVDFFLKAGFNSAAAAGMTAAIYVYSNFDPNFSKNIGTVADPSYIFGICGWSGDKVKEMERRVGQGWNKNLSGQLQYLLDDLGGEGYAGLLKIIKLADMTVSDAQYVAYNFMVLYNPYYNKIGLINDVKNKAKELYDKIIVTKVGATGNPTKIVNEDGGLLTVQQSIDIPDSVNQSGIMAEEDYTSYSAWYSGSPSWASDSTQREIADMWAYQGCPCDRGVATLDGYYLVAVRPKFGRVGDVIVVTLEDGSKFSAIIADEKGSDAGNEWGHPKSNGISLIEWEAIVTYNGEVQIEGASYIIIDGIEVDDWYKKKVVNITNYGCFLT